MIKYALFDYFNPNLDEKGWFLSKLDWSRDVTGKVDNIHSNLTRIFKRMILKYSSAFD